MRAGRWWILRAGGIVAEHLATRKQAGLFDVSHMGRFQIGGSGAVEFLQRVLTNDCARLAVGQAHYTTPFWQIKPVVRSMTPFSTVFKRKFFCWW
jgi:glycine cleavage system aminomethyltransferase T